MRLDYFWSLRSSLLFFFFLVLYECQFELVATVCWVVEMQYKFNACTSYSQSLKHLLLAIFKSLIHQFQNAISLPFKLVELILG